MKKIALIVGSDFKRNLPVASEVLTFLQDVPVSVKIQSDFAKEIGQEPPFLTDKEVVSDVDMVLVIGGDGTLLQAARLACPEGIPICGLNMGRLGFLSELDTQNWRSALTSILEGNFYLEERLTLKGTLFRDDGILREWLAINDVVLARNGFPHLMTLDIWLDGEETISYPADGVIIASPMGSTAYSLSAGGSILSPQLEAIAITPICAHDFYARPWVVTSDTVIDLRFDQRSGSCGVTADGEALEECYPGDRIRVEKSPWKAKFIRLSKSGYYNNLRTKFHRKGKSS